ncbi:MAG: Rab family GTPase [Methyloligellaceae bacterium]
MELTQKVMLLGDIGVGKTSIARRLVFNRFESQYKATIGVDIYTHDIDIPDQNHTIKLAIWDIDGDFDDSVFNHIYTKGASSALVIGDASRPHTQTSMQRLAEGFSERLPGRPIAFALNKMDLAPEDYKMNLPEAFLKPQMPFMLTSAKTGENINSIFFYLAETTFLRNL